MVTETWDNKDSTDKQENGDIGIRDQTEMQIRVPPSVSGMVSGWQQKRHVIINISANEDGRGDVGQ